MVVVVVVVVVVVLVVVVIIDDVDQFQNLRPVSDNKIFGENVEFGNKDSWCGSILRVKS